MGVYTFEDLSNPEFPIGATGSKWSVPNSVELTQSCNYDESEGAEIDDKVVDFTFNKMSPASTGFTGFTMTSQRSKPVQSASKLIPIIVHIVPLDAEYKIEESACSVDTKSSNVVVISANGPIGAVDQGLESAFTASVVDASGNVVPVTIESVKIASDINFLNVTLSDKLFAGDVATITYDATKEVTSVDNRKLKAFTTAITAKGGSILNSEINSFEKTPNPGFQTIGWATLGGPIFVAQKWVSQVQRPEGAVAGNMKSILFDIPSNEVKAPYYITQSAPEVITAGKYIIKLSVYVSSESTGAWDGAIDIKTVTPAVVLKSVAVDLAKRDQWQDLEVEYTYAKDTADKKLQIITGKGTQDLTGAKFYIDDLELIPTR
ncbi:MAG: hypothetical protein SNG14_04415 [Rikenellaceae bacterium]